MARFEFSGAHSGAGAAPIGAGGFGLTAALSNRNLLRILTIAVLSGAFLLYMAQVSARPACGATDAYVAGKLEALKSAPRSAA